MHLKYILNLINASKSNIYINIYIYIYICIHTHTHSYVYIYLAANLTMMVTKKGITLVMTVGLVPLFICLIGLFPYGFDTVNQVDK